MHSLMTLFLKRLGDIILYQIQPGKHRLFSTFPGGVTNLFFPMNLLPEKTSSLFLLISLHFQFHSLILPIYCRSWIQSRVMESGAGIASHFSGMHSGSPWNVSLGNSFFRHAKRDRRVSGSGRQCSPWKTRHEENNSPVQCQESAILFRISIRVLTR